MIHLDKAWHETSAPDFVADGSVGISRKDAMDARLRPYEDAEPLVAFHQSFVNEFAERATDGDRADAKRLCQLGEARQAAAGWISAIRYARPES